MRCDDEHHLKYAWPGAAPAMWTVRSEFFHQVVCRLTAASSQCPELGLTLCGHHLEIINNFIFELVLWKQNWMGQPIRMVRPEH